MFSFVKGLFKTTFWGVAILAGIGIASTFLIGPNSTQAVIHQVHESVQSKLDSLMDNPVALRAELQRLEAEYPVRIRAVQKDLGELQVEAKRLQWERAVSDRVVAMAQEDLGGFGTTASAQSGNGNLVLVAGFPVASVTNKSRAQVARIQDLVHMHSNRAEDAARDLSYLNKEIERFQLLLTELETERTQYHGQLEQLNRQVDSIRRNERLLEMLRQRQGLLEKAGNFKAHSLDQISGRLDGIRSQQEAELELLSSDDVESDYEGRAQVELHMEVREMQQASEVYLLNPGN
ncbi:MAG: peptidoglycan hydrolase CwlO-like protein [Planctomycetota bacterium]|jgi:peptidoglycan hydrolase CwlO-like protein